MSSIDDGSDLANCVNIRACPNAKSGVSIGWYPGAGEFCPACGEAIVRLHTASPMLAAPLSVRPDNRPMAIAGARPRHKVRIIAFSRLVHAQRIDALRTVEQPPALPTPAPPQVEVRLRWWPAALPIGLLFATAMTIVGVFALRPRIVGLAIPSFAQAGSLITLRYRATGFGTADYTVLRPDGQPLMNASLSPGTGTIALTLPKAAATQTYLLRLRAVNALASTTAEYSIAVPAATRTARRLPGIVAGARPAMDFPQIRSLALDRATLASGDGLGIYYDVAATSGTIALVDSASQMTYARAALAQSGHMSFTMPHVAEDRLLTVVLTARRGAQTIQSRVGVNVVAATATPDPNAGPVEPARADDSFPSGLSAPRTVRSRQPIQVDVRGASGDSQVVLRDSDGSEFERRDVRAGQQRVEFTAPSVHTTTRFTLEATIPEGDGNETLVREIAVTP